MLFRSEYASLRRGQRSFALPLNNPVVLPVPMATHMTPDDLVFGVIVKGQARAYPRWILLNYHVVNDVIKDEPIYLAHCEACTASSAFRSTLDAVLKGTLSFMICGARAGTFEVCDNQTLSRWHPFTGIARQGRLKGAAMERIPVVLEKWKTWADRFPDGEVVHAHPILRERAHGRRDRKSTRLNSSHIQKSRMPSSA